MATFEWTVVVAVFLVLASFAVWFMSPRGSSSKKDPPSPRAIPFFGHPFHLFQTSYSYVTKNSAEFGGSHVMKFFHEKVLFLTTWEDMKEALIVQSDAFPKALRKDLDMKPLHSHQKTFLFIDGPVWKEKRRFTLHHLRNLGFGKTTMEDTISEEFDRVCAVIDKNRTMTFDAFFFGPFLNVLWGVVAGKTYEYGDKDLERISDAIKLTFTIAKMNFIGNSVWFFKYVPGDPFKLKLLEQQIDTVARFIETQIDDHAASLSDGEPRDYMDAYLQEIKKRAKEPLTEETACYERGHLVGAIYDILQAGAETTSTTLEWGLLYMALWPEIQKKVQDELDAVIGRNRLPVYSDNTALPYVKATIMEIQRYCTVIPICSPRMAARNVNLPKFTVPKGAYVFQCLYAVHHDKKLWGDPEVFRPERFLTADGKAEKSDGWVPFSLGPRICLGESLARMELFLFFTGFMHKYSFRCVTGKPLPSIVPVITLTLRPQPFQLVVSPRELE